jgi:integrase
VKRTKRSKPEIIKSGNVAVRLYKRERQTANGKTRIIFEVADYTSGERRFRGFSDHEAAKTEATKIARQLASGETTAATMRNSDAASYGRALELLRPTGAALEVAAATYAKAFKILGTDAIVESATFYARHHAGHVMKRKIADVILEFIASREARGKSLAYINDLRQRLARFAKFTGAEVSTIYQPESAEQPDTRNRGMDVSAITTADVSRWLDGLKLSPQSTKNFRTVLHTLFAFGEARGYVFKGGNPVTDTESVEVNASDVKIFTSDEIGKLISVAPKDFQPLLTLGAFAGLRTAEILRLEWCDIDLAGGFITISSGKAKTRSRRLVPIQPNLKAWLEPYINESGLLWKRTVNDLQDARASTVKAAGVAWKDNGCRHSFISYRLAAIQNAAQVALEAGNSPNVVFKHYRELVKPVAAQIWFSIAPDNVKLDGKTSETPMEQNEQPIRKA